MIYVTGDCHGNFRRFQSEYFPEQAGMTKNDVVIIAGDFGGVWFGDERDDEAMKRWTGWNACPSRWYSSAATMKTMTRWNDIQWWSGTAVRYTVFVPMFCT